MPQRRIATSVLKARGAFARHPERERARRNEPKPIGELGPPPAHMSAKQQEIWYELADIIPPGVAAKSDRIAFEILVCLMEKLRKGKAKAGEINVISNLMGKMGMTPADRSRVSVTPPRSDEDKAWDEFTVTKPLP